MSRLSHILTVLTIAILSLSFLPSVVDASSGGRDKYGCHKNKGKDGRHWHVPGTNDEAGTCIKENGKNVKLTYEQHRARTQPPAVVPPTPPATVTLTADSYNQIVRDKDTLSQRVRSFQLRVTDLDAQITNLRSQLNASQRELRTAGRSISTLKVVAENAEKNRQEARTAEREALDRAAGHGPRVDSLCQNAVKVVVHGSTSWLSDNVKVDSSGRAALSKACLENL